MQTAATTPAPPPAEDDPSLVRRIVSGDALAFELLMRRHNRRLYRLARTTLRSDEEAEEALQEAYLSAYRAMPGFRGDSSLFTWLSRLVQNECLGRLRKLARRQHALPLVDSGAEDEIDAAPSPETDPPFHAAARAEMRALLESRLDELPQAYRTVFVLRSVEEMTVEETAQCLRIPEATVRSRHFRANSLLRASLSLDIDLAERNPFEFCGDDCDRMVAAVLAAVRREFARK